MTSEQLLEFFGNRLREKLTATASFYADSVSEDATTIYTTLNEVSHMIRESLNESKEALRRSNGVKETLRNAEAIKAEAAKARRLRRMARARKRIRFEAREKAYSQNEMGA